MSQNLRTHFFTETNNSQPGRLGSHDNNPPLTTPHPNPPSQIHLLPQRPLSDRLDVEHAPRPLCVRGQGCYRVRWRCGTRLSACKSRWRLGFLEHNARGWVNLQPPTPILPFLPILPPQTTTLARSWQGSPANHITKFSVPAFQEGRLHTTKYWLEVLVICQVFTQQVITRWSEQLQVFFPLCYILCSDLKFLSTITAYPPLSTISLSLKSFSCSSWTINQVSEESLRDEASLWSPFPVDQSS